MPSLFKTSWIDYSLEPSHEKLTITQLTAANVVAQLALVDTLLAATQAITLGQLAKSEVTFRSQDEDTVTPTDPNAQRERKWLVVYHDTTTGKKFRTEIPTADISSGNLQTNSDKANLADTQIAAYVAAFEAIVKDPDTGLNDVAIDYIQHVGKRL